MEQFLGQKVTGGGAEIRRVTFLAVGQHLLTCELS